MDALIRWLQLVASPARSKSETSHVGGTDPRHPACLASTAGRHTMRQVRRLLSAILVLLGAIIDRAGFRRHRECPPLEHQRFGGVQRNGLVDAQRRGRRVPRAPTPTSACHQDDRQHDHPDRPGRVQPRQQLPVLGHFRVAGQHHQPRRSHRRRTARGATAPCRRSVAR